MEIIVDKEAGFCFGVKRSVDLAFSIRTDKKVQALGELIHNKDFIAEMANRGIETVEEPPQLSCDVVIIRAHGVKKDIEKQLWNKYEVVDATCPFVKNVQTIAEKYSKDGYTILLLGEKNHPEVAGILSYAPEANVITSIHDIPYLNPADNILFISQTTQDKENFKNIADWLKRRFPNVAIKDTICDATTKKQQSVKELAARVDVMIILGGKNSCNTKNLYKISSELTRAYHIENENEIESDWFDTSKKVGITAGASTPDYIIERVYNKINSLFNIKAKV